MKQLLKISIEVALLIAATGTGMLVVANWFETPQAINACYYSEGIQRSFVPEELPAYQACIEKQAKLYLERDYAESKDLAKTFLTLLSATLVASITFSEKIVDVSKAGLLPFGTMIVCWPTNADHP